jgi:hypothetical protein
LYVKDVTGRDIFAKWCGKGWYVVVRGRKRRGGKGEVCEVWRRKV